MSLGQLEEMPLREYAAWMAFYNWRRDVQEREARKSG